MKAKLTPAPMPPRPPDLVTITMTYEEARVLRKNFGNAGLPQYFGFAGIGGPGASASDLQDVCTRMYYALNSIGVVAQ